MYMVVIYIGNLSFLWSSFKIRKLWKKVLSFILMHKMPSKVLQVLKNIFFILVFIVGIFFNLNSKYPEILVVNRVTTVIKKSEVFTTEP